MSDRVTFVGHSTVRMELGGTRLITDPLLRRRFLYVRRRADPPAPETLQVDGVVISHLHQDHLDFGSLRGLDRSTPFIAPVGGGRVLGRRGFHEVTELAPGETTKVGGVELTATPALHDGRRWPVGRPVQAVGYDIRFAGIRVYFAGDTDLFDGMTAMAEGERVDVALLPIGGWGPKVGPGHLDAHRAALAAAMIRPRTVVPIHWGTYLRWGLNPARLSAPPADLGLSSPSTPPAWSRGCCSPGSRWRSSDRGCRRWPL